MHRRLGALERVEDEAAVKGGGLVFSQTRAEACFDLSRDRSFGEDHQGCRGGLFAIRRGSTHGFISHCGKNVEVDRG